jgi:hypothetical protein
MITIEFGTLTATDIRGMRTAPVYKLTSTSIFIMPGLRYICGEREREGGRGRGRGRERGRETVRERGGEGGGLV